MRLLFVRHGETTSNINGMVQSILDPLTNKGLQQAQYVANRLKNEKFDVIYTSSQLRCKDTAKEIYKFHQSTCFFSSDILGEIDRGIYAGKERTTEIGQILQDIGVSLSKRPPQGESIEDVSKRAQQFIDYIISHHIQDTILVVGHSGFLKQFEIIIDRRRLQDINIMKNVGNASVSERIFEKDIRKNLVYNEQEFLGDYN